jgi:peptidyl-prolyl cis-trans isomerase SurA
MKLLLGLCFALALAVSAQAQVTRIVAVVNNDIITAGDIDARMNLIMRTSGIPDTPQNRQQLAGRVLQTLIDEKLEIQEAARHKVGVDKNEINKALANIEARNNMPKGGLEDYLKRLGIDRRSLVDQITASLTWNKVVQARYASDVSVSDSEVNDEIARIKADIGKPQSHVAEIFLAIDNPTQDAEIKSLADRLINQIRSGANFGALAQQFSQSPTAATGGDIGWVTPTQFGPPLDEAIAKMNPGQISYPIRTPAGYYILLLIDRRTPGQSSVNDTQLGLVEVVFPLAPGAPPQEQQRVTAQAQHVADTAKSCGEMARIAREQAPQLSTQTPNVHAGDLAPDLRATVLALKVGEASKPIPARGGIGVVMVCDRVDPPSPIPSRDQVFDQIMRQRMDQMSRRYLRDLRRNAYVDIRG